MSDRRAHEGLEGPEYFAAPTAPNNYQLLERPKTSSIPTCKKPERQKVNKGNRKKENLKTVSENHFPKIYNPTEIYKT